MSMIIREVNLLYVAIIILLFLYKVISRQTLHIQVSARACNNTGATEVFLRQWKLHHLTNKQKQTNKILVIILDILLNIMA